METIGSNGRVTEVKLTKREYEAYEIIAEGRELNLPPRDTLKSLQSANFSSSERRAGERAYLLYKQGAYVTIGSLPKFVGDSSWGRTTRFESTF